MTGFYKLNLGSGDMPRKGYINIDINPEKKEYIDLFFDVTNKLPFEDESVIEIYSHHLVEHIDPEQFVLMLKDWFRVLIKGGRVEINTPDIEGIMKEFLTTSYKRKEELMTGLIGYPEDPLMRHHIIYWSGKLEEMLSDAGFSSVEVVYQSQCNCPAMKLTATK